MNSAPRAEPLLMLGDVVRYTGFRDRTLLRHEHWRIERWYQHPPSAMYPNVDVYLRAWDLKNNTYVKRCRTLADPRSSSRLMRAGPVDYTNCDEGGVI